MHRATPIRVAAAAIVLLATGSAAFAQSADMRHVRSLAATCAACHGTDGKAVAGEATLPLAGLAKERIVSQVQDFRDGKRPATVMHQIAKGYTPEQIESIAAYFAAMK
jgi:cytochrome subunit of sulfide dehydrogenase